MRITYRAEAFVSSILSTVLLSAFILVSMRVSAQEVTAAINGLVTDPSGAAVAGAKVTATDLDRGTTYPTRTDNGGVYSLPRLPTGSDQIRVENPGFQISVQSKVVLELNQVAKVDFQLKVGNVNQTVEVTAAAPVLQTENTQLGTVIDSRAIVGASARNSQLQSACVARTRRGYHQPSGVQLPAEHIQHRAPVYQRKPGGGQLLPSGWPGEYPVRRK